MTGKGGKTWNPDAAKRAASPAADLGPMPAWDLSDLYSDPKSEAVRADIEKAGWEIAFDGMEISL